MSAPRKYSDAFVARVKAMWLLRLGDKKISYLVGAPLPTVRYIIKGYQDVQPDNDFINRFKQLCKGDL